MRHVAIIGGGIAGLSAAFYLERARQSGEALEWTLFEQSNRLGGVIQTERRGGYVLEAGPDSFLTERTAGAEFCRDLGIHDQLIPSNDAERKTYILVAGRLVPIPDGLQFMIPTRIWPMIHTSLFSLSTKLRMARERFAPSPFRREDESVASFVRRHFGQQMVDRVAEPLLAGVYGGDAERLSVNAVLPRFVTMERQHGSLVRATLKARRGRTGVPQSLFTSLQCGMQQMVDAAVSALPAASLRLNQEDIALRRLGDGWQVAGNQGRQTFDAVLLAVPAPAAAKLLEPVRPALASLLAEIQYTSSAAVVLAYHQAAGLPPGFGFLVPRSEGRKMLACTFMHKKFPHRAPAGAALLRCFFSSSRVPGLLGYSDAALLDVAQRELHDIMGFTARPCFNRVFRWERALPQYEIGHPARAGQIEKHLAELPGVQLIGNSLYGVGIPDCIKSARQAVARISTAALQPVSV